MRRTLKAVLMAASLVAAATLGFAAFRVLYVRPVPVQTAAATEPAPAATKIPDMRPVFSLQDRDGKLRSITDWDGKSLVVNFWATWCPPCRREIPMLKELSAARSAQNFVVIGIAVDFRDPVLAYAKEVGINYPLLIGEQEGLDAAAAFGLGSMGFPFTVFTDAQGRIVTAHLGELHLEQANLILDTVLEVNRGALTLEQAKTRIADGMKATEHTAS